jgi:hypothetical protein
MPEDHEHDQRQGEQVLLLQQQLQLFEQEPLVDSLPVIVVPQLPAKTSVQYHDDDLGDGFDCCR